LATSNFAGNDSSGRQYVAVDGATGYLGSHLIARLCQDGYAARALVHPGARAKDVDFLRACGAEVVEVSLEKNDQALVRALSGCPVVVHLIGSIAPRKGESLEELHGNQTRNLIEAGKVAGVGKFVQVTALGTASEASNTYHATKWQAEQFVRNSGKPYVILRPSLIVGRQVGNRDSKLVSRYFELIKTRPAVPVIGGGSNKVQPVFVGDLVSALVKSFDSRLDNNVYEIGGPEVMTMRDFVAKLIKLSGSTKPIRGLPVFAASVAAMFCEAFQNVPLISRDQVKLSTGDNICRDNALATVFGVTPTAVDEALKTYTSDNCRSAARV
jgi:nucleoside-diphosphate-sugar epimerase